MTHSPSSEPLDFDLTEGMANIVEKQVKAAHNPPVNIYAVRNVVSSAADDDIPTPLCFQTGLALHPEIWG